MCVVYVCMSICMYVRMHACMYVCIHDVCMCVCARAHARTRVRAHKHRHIHTIHKHTKTRRRQHASIPVFNATVTPVIPASTSSPVISRPHIKLPRPFVLRRSGRSRASPALICCQNLPVRQEWGGAGRQRVAHPGDLEQVWQAERGLAESSKDDGVVLLGCLRQLRAHCSDDLRRRGVVGSVWTEWSEGGRRNLEARPARQEQRGRVAAVREGDVQDTTQGIRDHERQTLAGTTHRVI